MYWKDSSGGIMKRRLDEGRQTDQLPTFVTV